MSSFRDKINSKLSINNPSKPIQQKIESFDQTWIKVTVVGGQTQLCPIKLNCNWTSNLSNRPPELLCKWFNKTDTSISLIEGISGSYYQPCFSDIGTTIHVQCIPQMQGADYEGMPIIKQIGPIKLDPETEQEANDLLSGKKATFSIKIKNLNSEPMSYEGLIKIQGNTFKVIQKHNESQKQLVNTQIRDSILSIKCNKVKNKQVEIIHTRFSSQDHIVVQLSNNKIKDVLALLLRLISAKIQAQQQKIKSLQSSQMAIHKVQQKQHQKNIQIIQNIQKLDNDHHNTLQTPKQQTTQKQNINENYTKQTQKSSNKQKSKNSDKKSEFQQFNEQDQKNTKNKLNFNQIKSSQNLTTIPASPVTKKNVSKFQESPSIATGGKSNAFQIIQITDLKKQLRVSQGQIHQLKKTIAEKDQQIGRVSEQIDQLKQREKNLSVNFFQLEDQIKKMKDGTEKNSQQISYYKNQNRILKSQNQSNHKKIKQQSDKIISLQQRIALYLEKSNQQQTKQTYLSLRQNYQSLLLSKQEIQAKYQYMRQQSLKWEEKFNQIRESLVQIEDEKNFYKKKYQNLSQQLYSQNNLSQSLSSTPKSSKILKQSDFLSRTSSLQTSPNEKINEQYNNFQKQILQLKKQLKENIEQNNFLRSLNAISAKDKKSSSKNHLKLELAQMKKIVNKLTQAVTQKDMALQNVKNINRDINNKLIQYKKKIDQLQTINILEERPIKHSASNI